MKIIEIPVYGFAEVDGYWSFKGTHCWSRDYSVFVPEGYVHHPEDYIPYDPELGFDDEYYFTGGYAPAPITAPQPAPLPLPVVDASDLKKNPKIDCIYQKLMQGNIMPDLVNRFFGMTEPVHSFLGELNLTWTIEDLSQLNHQGMKVLANTYPEGSPSNPNNFIRIAIDQSHANDATTAIALSLLHEALHAKLISEYYDALGTTDFATLFTEHKHVYGTEAQHWEMSENSYIRLMAEGLQQFDNMNGLSRSLEFYMKASGYQIKHT